MKFLFVQCQPSQLDAPFYKHIAEFLPGGTLVVLYNESDNKRLDIDPELGFTPVFPNLDTGYSTEWVGSGRFGIAKLMRRIVQLKPECLVLQDLRWIDKIAIALCCRLWGIKVAMRSDKNKLSERVHEGFYLSCEQIIVRLLFDVLCPVSELTVEYYDWPENRPVSPFPYCTDEKKFARPDDVRLIRNSIRGRFKIPDEAFVFLVVAKFVDRENPAAAISAFKTVVALYPNAWLLMVGAGPTMERDQCHVIEAAIANIVFAGYVPYPELEAYFFAADVFMHLARREPWGVSPQDALLAGLGLIASNRVGSAVSHLTDTLSHFIVPVDDISTTSDRMMQLILHNNIQKLFQPAKARVLNDFTTESVAKCWANKYK